MTFIRDMSIIDQAHYPEVILVVYSSSLLLGPVHFFGCLSLRILLVRSPSQRLACIIIINAPRLVSMVWNFIAQFLDQVTRDKVHIFSGNEADWRPVVDRLIAPDQLPCTYGGTAPAIIPTGQPLPIQSSILPAAVEMTQAQPSPSSPPIASACSTNANDNNGDGNDVTANISLKDTENDEMKRSKLTAGMRWRFLKSSTMSRNHPDRPSNLSSSVSSFLSRTRRSPPTAVLVPPAPFAESRLAADSS